MNQLSAYHHPYLKNCLKIFKQDGTIVPYEVNFFPDGQLQIKIKKEDLNNEICNFREPLTIYASLFNSASIDLFYQLIDTFPIQKVKVNYLYGARSDKNESGNYFVSNVADLMVSGFDMKGFMDGNVEFLAPHCHEILKQYRYNVNFDLPDCVNLDNYDLVIFPDESAQKRYKDVNKTYIICEKHRDQETGKILSHVIPNLPDGVKRVIVMDDLCDGGKTFENISDILPDNVVADLFIFHGVFSNCAPIRLFEKYFNIYVSNSLPHVEEMANIFNQWKNNEINYKQACEQLVLGDFLQYKDFTPGNLIVFDVWDKK